MEIGKLRLENCRGRREAGAAWAGLEEQEGRKGPKERGDKNSEIFSSMEGMRNATVFNGFLSHCELLLRFILSYFRQLAASARI